MFCVTDAEISSPKDHGTLVSNLLNHFSSTNTYLGTINDCFSKMGNPQPLFRLFSVLFKQSLQQINVKNPLYGARFRIYDLQNATLIP